MAGLQYVMECLAQPAVPPPVVIGGVVQVLPLTPAGCQWLAHT